MVKTTGSNTSKSFTLKGGLYTLTTLHLQSAELTAINAELIETVKQAPKFFDHTPVVIDLQDIAKSTENVDMNELAGILRGHGLIPIGIRGGNDQQKQNALATGWALLPETQKQETSARTPKSVTTNVPTKLITAPVRSGQQIYAKGGDLIVMAPVSAGAEIMADGHIHVYAPLRGRAMAGVMGNTEARIFCQQLEAELIAIAGHYKVSEQLKDQISAWEKSAIISLENDNLVIQPL
ncbi:MAG: septum site-determining protein MinC [Legionellales bacterium]